MRDNNIYLKDYEEQLNSEGITPEQQCLDIIDLIREKGGFYDELREKVETYLEHYKSGKKVKKGRKLIEPWEYLQSFTCDPAGEMTKIENRHPVVMEPIPGTNSFRTYRDLEEDAKECRLLHWILLELDTILHRPDTYWHRGL